jgi:type II secretory pathway pseudopilin PulG
MKLKTLKNSAATCASVTQVSKPAVSPASKSVGVGSEGRVEVFDAGLESCDTAAGLRTRAAKTRLFGRSRQARRLSYGFTLAEVLAALMFMAIVIPVAVDGLRVASLAGEVAQRKDMATRVAERVLNEAVVTRQWNQAVQSGAAQEGALQYKWTLRAEPWGQDALRQFSVEVAFSAHGQDYSVRLSTLVDTTATQ